MFKLLSKGITSLKETISDYLDQRFGDQDRETPGYQNTVGNVALGLYQISPLGLPATLGIGAATRTHEVIGNAWEKLSKGVFCRAAVDLKAEHFKAIQPAAPTIGEQPAFVIPQRAPGR